MRSWGVVDVDGLWVALTGLVGRHESVRTTFEAVDGRGVQVVHPPGVVSLPVVDLWGLVESQRVVELGRVVAVDSRRPFGLVRGPLLRGGLVRVGGSEHVADGAMSHLIPDGWAMGVLCGGLGVVVGRGGGGRCRSWGRRMGAAKAELPEAVDADRTPRWFQEGSEKPGREKHCAWDG